MTEATLVCEKCGGTGKVIDPREEGAEWRARREKAGISLRQMAETMGISPAYLSDLEHGNRVWREELRAKVRSALRR